jgi:hypothetical protein
MINLEETKMGYSFLMYVAVFAVVVGGIAASVALKRK